MVPEGAGAEPATPDMNEQQEPQPTPVIHGGWPTAQLAGAFTTALTDGDPDTRRRAERRVERWRAVLSGMADGTLTVGSRTPVAGLPAWVTPEVLRGGFATGAAVAGGPLLPYETEAARQAGVPADRGALFTHHLTDRGLAELTALLDSGRYAVGVPEEAALLTVAWLVRHGEVTEALRLLDVLEPFAGRLRFTPRPADEPVDVDGTTAYRTTVGQATATLARRTPNRAVETMNEALTVWNPLADEFLALWLRTAVAGEVLAHTPDDEWRRHAEGLLQRYRVLAATHTLCRKHLRPKENPAILRDALERTVAGQELDPRRLGLLRAAVTKMVARRGAPGSAHHGELRARQSADAALPTHHALAQLVVRRMSGLPQDTGTPRADLLVGPVGDEEQELTGIPAGTAIPAALARTVTSTLSAPVGTLIERGVVPSAEVLAELVPHLVAAATSLAYPDPALRRLMAATYRAFRDRRSLLLVDLAHQVRIEELPWVRAVAEQRRSTGLAADSARTALVELAGLALQGFPATILPNPLISEFSALARGAGMTEPFVEELAADIFMGTFSPKFLAAACVAGELLAGSVYERYYGIDYRRLAADDVPGFAKLCHERARIRTGRSVAADGMVIEQAQILTTHNLATLAGPVGAVPSPGWDDLARRSFRSVVRLVALAQRQARPLATIKDAAYAWRQTVFQLSQCTSEGQAALVDHILAETAGQPGQVRTSLDPVAHGLWLVVMEGVTFGPDGTADGGRARQFLGWSEERHWMRRGLLTY